MKNGDEKMIVIMQKEAKKSEINAILKSLRPLETYVSRLDGRNIIVVK